MRDLRSAPFVKRLRHRTVGFEHVDLHIGLVGEHFDGWTNCGKLRIARAEPAFGQRLIQPGRGNAGTRHHRHQFVRARPPGSRSVRCRCETARGCDIPTAAPLTTSISPGGSIFPTRRNCSAQDGALCARADIRTARADSGSRRSARNTGTAARRAPPPASSTSSSSRVHQSASPRSVRAMRLARQHERRSTTRPPDAPARRRRTPTFPSALRLR